MRNDAVKPVVRINMRVTRQDKSYFNLIMRYDLEHRQWEATGPLGEYVGKQVVLQQLRDTVKALINAGKQMKG
jgi:hypothetical protein